MQGAPQKFGEALGSSPGRFPGCFDVSLLFSGRGGGYPHQRFGIGLVVTSGNAGMWRKSVHRAIGIYIGTAGTDRDSKCRRGKMDGTEATRHSGTDWDGVGTSWDIARGRRSGHVGTRSGRIGTGKNRRHRTESTESEKQKLNAESAEENRVIWRSGDRVIAKPIR